MTISDDINWIIGEIQNAQSIERLNYLADIIKFDADHGYEYALEPHVKQVREAWAKRRGDLRDERATDNF